MPRMELVSNRPVHRPFADWMADVDRQIERRTGQRTCSNEAPNDFWLSLFHCGELPRYAADEFIEERRR